MSSNKNLLLLALIAVVAITGLILMIQYEATGLGAYGGGLYRGKAIRKVGVERFVKAANAGAIPISSQPRTRRFNCTGLDPCPEGYRTIPMNQYLRVPGYYEGKCVDPLCPEENIDIKCCKSSFSIR